MNAPISLLIPGRGDFPGSSLPVVIYRKALPADPVAMLRRFAAQGWTNGWTNGIYDFDHFHSIAHEVLGIASGWVEVSLGAGAGPTLRLAAGDVIALPAGVAHRNMGAAADLLVAGAYDRGRDWDLRRGDPAEAASVRAAMAAVPLPRQDPVADGPGRLPALWDDAAGG